MVEYGGLLAGIAAILTAVLTYLHNRASVKANSEKLEEEIRSTVLKQLQDTLAQVNILRSEILAMSQQIVTLSDENTKLKQSVAELKQKIRSLEAANRILRTSVRELIEQMKEHGIEPSIPHDLQKILSEGD